MVREQEEEPSTPVVVHGTCRLSSLTEDAPFPLLSNAARWPYVP